MPNRRGKYVALTAMPNSKDSGNDLEHVYYRGLSGLGSGSVTDHKRAYFLNLLGNTAVNRQKSTTQLETEFWTNQDATNNVGSYQDRAKKFFG